MLYRPVSSLYIACLLLFLNFLFPPQIIYSQIAQIDPGSVSLPSLGESKEPATLASENNPGTSSMKTDSRPRLNILPPVFLNDLSVSASLAKGFRDVVLKDGKFQVLTPQRTKEVYAKFGIDYEKPCYEITCAYDAGNILQADYTLISTLSQIQDYYLYTFTLISQKNTVVVWSQVGEVRTKHTNEGNYGPLEYQLKQGLQPLDTLQMSRLLKKPSQGVLGILSQSEGSKYSRSLLQRLTTQVQKLGKYEAVAQSEMSYLLQTLGLDTIALRPQPSVLLPLGKQLSVDYLLYSRFREENNTFGLHLSLYDIKTGKLVRDWPINSVDFKKLLSFEDKFVAALNTSGSETGQAHGGRGRLAFKWGLAGALLATSAVTGYLGYQALEDHNKSIDRADNAKTTTDRDTHLKIANDQKKNLTTFAVISGVALASVSLVYFF